MPGAGRRSRGARAGAVRAVVALALLAAGTPAVAKSFDFEDAAAVAKKLAEQPFQEPKGQVPDWLLKISYDQWRDIRYRPDRALWRDKKLPFQVQFFHPGLFYDRTVRVDVVERGGVKPVAFSPSQFDYGKNDFASRIPQDLGYAGFRVHAPFKTKDYFDEVIVFLGASYFRAVGRDEVFGLSARGLAIDTAEPRGEEFPYFKRFWLVTPAPGARELVIYALLDSPSLAGAYRFAVTPGEQTTVKVRSRLFLRREVRKLGIAPLTSMFLHGENTGRWFDDFRPEVHDSDGVLLSFPSGEWLWRPVDNPRTLHVSALGMEQPKGFGLLQRDREFAHYQDLETRQDLRPSVWIAPDGDWQRGRVEVIEIPTEDDTNDNVVAFWVPGEPPKPGTPFDVGYTMSWYGDDATRPPGGRVIATRRDSGPPRDKDKGLLRFVLDFTGKKLAQIPADQVLRGVVTVAGGDDAAELVNQHVVKNPADGSWRVSFQMKPKKREPIELRAFLDQGGETLSETWSYAVAP
jgi:periplasmic glucans biosynthesis protein